MKLNLSALAADWNGGLFFLFLLEKSPTVRLGPVPDCLELSEQRTGQIPSGRN